MRHTDYNNIFFETWLIYLVAVNEQTLNLFPPYYKYVNIAHSVKIEYENVPGFLKPSRVLFVQAHLRKA
jgi:hypothetical protein